MQFLVALERPLCSWCAKYHIYKAMHRHHKLYGKFTVHNRLTERLLFLNWNISFSWRMICCAAVGDATSTVKSPERSEEALYSAHPISSIVGVFLFSSELRKSLSHVLIKSVLMERLCSIKLKSRGPFNHFSTCLSVFWNNLNKTLFFSAMSYEKNLRLLHTFGVQIGHDNSLSQVCHLLVYMACSIDCSPHHDVFWL